MLAEPGVGPIVAATVLTAWSHPGRCRNDAAFAMPAGTAPIPASSGKTVRYRLGLTSADRAGRRWLPGPLGRGWLGWWRVGRACSSGRSRAMRLLPVGHG
ncbi:transposase [Micromonospora sp. L31]|uniref:transposase n=1 Tax=Micromonospora sp. L31 TaxID=3452213 RepID=UPI003F8872C8